jgi:signal transduction histidine kinase
VISALVIGINLVSSGYLTFIHSFELGSSGHIDLVDLSGTILASTRPARVGHLTDARDNLPDMIRKHHPAVSTGHNCLTSTSAPDCCTEVLAFAPLDRAEWGVAVRQSEEEVSATARALELRIVGLMVVCVVGALVFVYLTTRSVIHPVQALTTATRRIAGGDLDTAIPTSGKDEIGSLARSFDAMRVRLKEWSHELDTRVREATAESRAALKQNALLYAELQEKEQMRRELLHRVFSAQEEERKRISRELHDETCQILNSLAYDLDNIGEMLVHGEASSAQVQPLLENMRSLAKMGRDGVSRIIFDLRPTMLDHLGLVPALRWYAETRFSDLGIRYSFREVGSPRRLLPSVETALFRVVQEAVNNIAQHSRARHADFFFEYLNDRVEVRISDDGRGFDRTAVENAVNGKRGLGLVGMEERMTAVGGQFRLQSAPGKGSLLQLSVPLASAVSSGEKGGAGDGQNPSDGRG